MGIVNSFIHDIFEKLRHWNYPQQQDMSPSNLLKCRLQTADSSLPYPCQAHYLSRHQCCHQFHRQRTHPNLSHIHKTFHLRQYLALKFLDPVAAMHFVPHQTSKCIFRNYSICSHVSLYQCTQYTDQLINTHSIQSLKNSQSRMLTKRTNNLKNWQPLITGEDKGH